VELRGLGLFLHYVLLLHVQRLIKTTKIGQDSQSVGQVSLTWDFLNSKYRSANHSTTTSCKIMLYGSSVRNRHKQSNDLESVLR
jgi:hypothetical protein